ncbi:MBL fold metallo-hydrolase [Paenibacillus chartarius]|uniref:MBL fold metallo-hydrolase n=1 Tax=Paenibacillus chartarius TaxID=747481 RepID=A0ABV6DLE4_9BACL
MKIAPGVHMLELEIDGFGGKSVLCPTLIQDENGAVLIDTGMPGSLPLIHAAMRKDGVDPASLQAIVVTHQDFDHIGSLPDLIGQSGSSLTVYAHELDRPYIEGKLPLIKTTPERMAPVLERFPDEVRRQALAMFSQPPKAPVTDTVADGDELPYGGGIQVIHTPGHTDGHISLYVKRSKTLIAADAMLIVNGALHRPVPQTTLDMEEAMRSLHKLAKLDIEAIVCYHGGLIAEGAGQQLRQLIAESR